MSKPASTSVRARNSGFGPRLGANWPWQKRRDWFRERLGRNPPPDIGPDELEAHFSGMPAHYWQQVDEADLLWGLAAIHGFLKLVTTAGASATKPYMEWRPVQPPGHARVVLCTWDRLGLLAKAAAAFSELRLSILAAEAFKRSDDLALVVFTIVDLEKAASPSEERLKSVLFLLEGALSEPPRFASVWMCSRHKYLGTASPGPAKVSFDHRGSGSGTVVRIEAADRLGLLYDILHALAEEGLNVTEAHIHTEDQHARDLLHITDAAGNKVVGAERLRELRSKLSHALSLQAT